MARVAFILDELFEDSKFQVPYDRSDMPAMSP
jgi:hypothetical protein